MFSEDRTKKEEKKKETEFQHKFGVVKVHNILFSLHQYNQ